MSAFPRCALVLLLAAAAPAGAGEHWAQDAGGAAYMAGLRAFFQDAQTRMAGSPGNLALENKVAAIFAASGFEHGAISFNAPAFRPGPASLSYDGGPAVTLLAMHPSLIRPGNFTERDFQAPLIDLRMGTIADLAAAKGLDLNGALVLLDYACGWNWNELLRFGVRGFIFVESEQDEEYWDATSKVHMSEVRVPRYFVSARDGARLRTALRAQRNFLPVHIKAEPSRWENALLRDLWVIIPGQDPALSKEVCVCVAPLDANSVVPELAQGAQNGANLYLLLKLLEYFRRQPPARTLVLAAVNAHTQYYAGERMLAWHMAVRQEAVGRLRDLLAAEISPNEMYSAQFQKLADLLADESKTAETDAYLIQLRQLTDTSTGKRLTVKTPLVTLLRHGVNSLKQRLQQQGTEPAAAHQDLAAELARYVKVLQLFNKWGHATRLSDPDFGPAERQLLRAHLAQLLETMRSSLALAKADLARDEANDLVRGALAGRRIRWVMHLDLAWHGRQVGLCSGEYWADGNWGHAWAEKTVEVAAQLARQRGRENLFVDTMTAKGGQPEGYYFPFPYPHDVLFFQHSIDANNDGIAAFSLRNVFVHEERAFGPHDTFDGLDSASVAELSAYVPEFLRALLSADNTMLHGKIGPIYGIWSAPLLTRRFDKFSPAVFPEIPVPGTLVTLRAQKDVHKMYPETPVPLYGDVLAAYLGLTDERGAVTFYGINQLNGGWLTPQSVACHFDADFVNVDYTIDGGDKETSLSSNIYRRPDQWRTLVLFGCREFPLYARDDSTAIGLRNIAITSVLPLDARRESKPRQFGLFGLRSPYSSKTYPEYQTGPAAVLAPPDMPLKLLAGNLVVLGAREPEFEGTGFRTAEELGPDLMYFAAHDLFTLSNHRLAQLQGISQDLARDFLDRARHALDQMDAARQAQDHVGYLQAQYAALGAARAAYSEVTDITNDLLRAVVFYMALILPFCFFLQKLLFNFVKIEAQIAAFFALFSACYLAFRQIHPAFEIAKAPEGILLAFVMGALGAFVIKILHGRFEGEMTLLFRNDLGVDTSDVGYSTVGQKAMLIGVNNMRRRRVRTVLTTATIVLVTFTMLSFTSISKQMSPTVVNVSREAPPYTGFMYHWPLNCMDESTLNVFTNLFYGKADVLPRRWMFPPKFAQWTLTARCAGMDGQTAQIEAALGLSVQEHQFLAPLPLDAGRNFSANDAHEVIVPASLAEILGITPDNLAQATLTFFGRTFKVAGIINDNRFRTLKDLDGLMLMPQKERPGQEEAMLQSNQATAPDTLAASQQAGFYVEPSALLILPVDTAARLGAQPYSVSVRFPEGRADLWDEVLKLLTVTQAKFYIGSRAPFTAQAERAAEKGTFIAAASGPGMPERPAEEKKDVPVPGGGAEMGAGVYYVGGGFRTSLGNLASLLIPLLISGTIILNTMLGAVFERKKEIAVYNAIGLNSNHVGLFFLSEAFVYSVIGTVSGYLIGQGLSIALIHLNVQGINLNFSSLKVVYVILFTIAMVLLSTLYPAIVATRAAVPSGKRRWSFPAHDGQSMRIVFPFIYHPDLVTGVLGYLEEYFARFTEASLGTLIATPAGKSRGRDAQGRETYTLAYDLALAPFDLGVTQRVTFFCAYGERVQSYNLAMTNVRVSGQDVNWVTVNKPFLERLRTYLLHWRNLDAAQRKAYVQAEGEKGRKGEEEKGLGEAPHRA